MSWHKFEVYIKSKKIRFIIYHNLKVDGFIDSIQAALDNWSSRNKGRWTARDLCDYIVSKQIKYGVQVAAFTEEDMAIMKTGDVKVLKEHMEKNALKNPYI